jgi:hypothetical protein
MTVTCFDEDGAAAQLLDSFGPKAARRGEPIWLELRAGGQSELETHQVCAREGLLGRSIGSSWSGAAVVGTGRLRLLDAAHEPPAAVVPGLAGGLTMVCVVSRRGATGWRMRLPDGTLYEPMPEHGFMLDILRRSLDLPTSPPTESTVILQLIAWIGTIVGVGTGRSERLAWEEALRLHPALCDRPSLAPIDAEAIVCTSGSVGGWESMRRLVGAGLEAPGTPPADLARWMDEGMFARWVLSELPPLLELVPETRSSLEPAAYRRLTHLVRTLPERADVSN